MEKEIIILAYYINISNIPGDMVNEYLYKVHENFNEIEWPEDSFVKTFLIPVDDQRSHIDCIYPVNMNDEKTNKAFQKLSDATDKILLYIKDAINNDNIKN